MPGIGERGGNSMKRKINYTDAPDDIHDAIINAREVEDFLPPPELLFTKEETKKITISLSRKSIDYFKEVSKQNHIPYQQLIRKILDNYTEHYAK